MEEKEHKCFNCGSFNAYYIKAYCSFLREDCGMCRRHNKVVSKKSSCENWRSKFYDHKKSKSAVMSKLKEVLTDISIIKQFIEDK